MKKIIILAITLVLLFLVINVSGTAKADDNEYKYNGIGYGYYGSLVVHPFLQVFCDYPEDIPHTFDTYWGGTESWEYPYLEIPDRVSSLEGRFLPDSFGFYLGTTDPPEGQYTVKLIANNSELLFECDFNLSYGFDTNILSAKWVYINDAGYRTSNDAIDKNSIGTVQDISLSLTFDNIGDIPLSIGCQEQMTLPINYQINLYKNGETEPIFTSDTIKVDRPSCDFQEQGYMGGCYFDAGETINYTGNIELTDFELENHGAGDYSVDGQVKIGNFTCNFSSGNILKISVETDSDGTPGFELILMISAIIFILVKKRKKQN